MESLNIRYFQDEDIPLYEKWLNKDYIIKWYHNPNEWLNEVKSRHDEFSFVNHYIVTYKDKPIGFCQYYACIDSNEDWNGYKYSSGTYSIDYLIGEEDYLKRGFGKDIINILVSKVFSIEDATEIIVAPEPENIPSCKSLFLNGFTLDNEHKLYYKSK